MERRTYDSVRRRAASGRTRAAILAAARDQLAAGAQLSVGAVASSAGVCRLTVYDHFGSKAALIEAVGSQARPGDRPAPPAGSPRQALEARLEASCRVWAQDPALFRRLPSNPDREENHELALFLASAGGLRPGCSIREAEDVVGILTAFETFDRLHRDGRRPVPVLVQILMRLAGGILA